MLLSYSLWYPHIFIIISDRTGFTGARSLILLFCLFQCFLFVLSLHYFLLYNTTRRSFWDVPGCLVISRDVLGILMGLCYYIFLRNLEGPRRTSEKDLAWTLLWVLLGNHLNLQWKYKLFSFIRMFVEISAPSPLRRSLGF